MYAIQGMFALVALAVLTLSVMILLDILVFLGTIAQLGHPCLYLVPLDNIIPFMPKKSVFHAHLVSIV